jgi:hypothetical protein
VCAHRTEGREVSLPREEARSGSLTDVTDPGLRASDADRQRVVAALERHTSVGRLTLDEFSDRVGQVFAAATLGELALVTRDLPAEAPAAADPHPLADQARQLMVTLLISLGTLIVLGVVLALTGR